VPTAATADVLPVTEPRWYLSCHDPFGRDRAVTVLVEGEAVVLVSPPGSSAVMSPAQTRQLGRTLEQAGLDASAG